MVNISKSTIFDAQQIRLLENRVHGEDVTNKYDIPMLIRFGYSFVAKDDKKIVGAIIAYPTRNNGVYVCDWVVNKKYQRRGIGWMLYQRLLQVVKGKTIFTFVNSKNKPSIHGHTKLGFKKYKRIKDPFKLGRKTMWLMLRKKN